jgi:hypothetical protein
MRLAHEGTPHCPRTAAGNIFGPTTPGRDLRIGEIRRRVQLGTEAVYRVLAVSNELAEVEVVKAPGLAPGQRFKFTVDAVCRMTVVVAPVDRADPPRELG